jgi:ABC-type sugar transport system permease subunit
MKKHNRHTQFYAALWKTSVFALVIMVFELIIIWLACFVQDIIYWFSAHRLSYPWCFFITVVLIIIGLFLWMYHDSEDEEDTYII